MDAAIPADAQNAPTGIWKSRTEREIPTAPTPIIVVVNERKNNGDSNSVAKLSTESDQAQDAFYRVNTKGDMSSGTDSFTYDVAVGWRASPSSYQTFRERVLNLYLEFNGRHEMGAGDLLYLSPGVQFIARQNMLVELSTQIPVYQDFTGIRVEVDYTVSGGFRWLFLF